MEHLGYQVENLLEQAAKEELNYREFLCRVLQQEGAGAINAAWSPGRSKPGSPG